MQVAIVGDPKSGPDVVCDLLSSLGYKVAAGESESRAAGKEFEKLFAINVRLLTRLGGTPDLPPRLDESWEDRPELDGFYNQAHDSVDRLNALAQDWGWHDPATNVTAAFWRKLLPQMRFVVCVRNPRDVVAQIPHLSGMDRSFAYAKWHWTYLNILGATTPDRRVTVVYDRLVKSEQHRLNLAKILCPPAMLGALKSLPTVAADGPVSSISQLLKDKDIHEAARRLYIGLESGEDDDEIRRQLEVRDVLLSVLTPILERSAAYDALSARCSQLEHELSDIARSRYIVSNLGSTLVTGAVHVARRSRSIVSALRAPLSKRPNEETASSRLYDSAAAAQGLSDRPNARHLIVCAGHERSGSTWLFNVLRCAHICAGYKTYGAWIGTYRPDISADVHIVKAHSFDPGLCKIADTVAVTRRDLRDCAASMLRKKWVGNTPDEVAQWLRTLIKEQIAPWRDRADIMVAYEDVAVDKIGAIARILDGLGLGNINPVDVDRWVENLTQEVYPDVNPTSLLHPQHVTDGRVRTFDQTLSPELVAAVEKVCAEFEVELNIDANDNPVDIRTLDYTLPGTSADPNDAKTLGAKMGRACDRPRNSKAARNPSPQFNRDSFTERDETGSAPLT